MNETLITVTLTWAPPGSSDAPLEHVVRLPVGITLADVLQHPQVTVDGACSQAIAGAKAVGIWGKVRSGTTVLREGDRIELYAPLKADPKEQRRRRAA